MRLDDLRSFSPLTWLVERIFFILQFTSPANLLFGTRTWSQAKMHDEASTQKETKRRGRLIDGYLCLWLAIEGCCVYHVCTRTPPPGSSFLSLIVILPLFRVFEIVQTAVNISLFDRLRGKRRLDRVSTVTRMLLFSLINFGESMVCFGIVYAALPDMLLHSPYPYDAFYFSVITQLTIGYGDIQPAGAGRCLAAVQGLTGFILALVMLSRFVALLPKFEAILGDD